MFSTMFDTIQYKHTFFFIILHLYASINTGTLSIFSFYIEHDCNIAFECSLNVLKEVVAFKIKY